MSYPRRSAWRGIPRGQGVANFGSAAAGGTYMFFPTGVVGLTQPGSGYGVFYFDPAEHDTAFVRVRAVILTNAVAPGVNFVAKLSRVASVNGASNVRPGVASLTDIATATLTTPAASQLSHVEGAEVAAPVAGFYALAVTLSGSTAVNSNCDMSAELQLRGS